MLLRISAVPPFPGLRRFPEGRDFTQWTGDDSKALMKVSNILFSSHELVVNPMGLGLSRSHCRTSAICHGLLYLKIHECMLHCPPECHFSISLGSTARICCTIS